MTDQRARAQGLLGAALVVLGVVGFFYNGDFTSNRAIHDDVFGAFSVNGWHNALHVVTGASALAAGTRGAAAGLGLLYVLLAAWGFALGSGHSILGIFPVNTADDVLHLAFGLAFLAVAAR